jgi:CRISPR system Cascade subunit CasE
VTLHLVRLPLNLGALAAFAAANRAGDDDGGYALHLALRQRFGTAGPQPFRLFADGPAAPHLLGYTADADALTEAEALPAVDPLLDAAFGAPQLRAMPDTWREGARFGFEVRVRPVVRFGTQIRAARAASDAGQAAAGWYARAGEVDAWVAARTRPGGDPALTREAAYTDWLMTRLKPAAALERAELTLARRVRTRRSTHGKPGRAGVEGPEAVIAGVLAIRDPAAFAQALARGVGRHAAFGFGMLLLSPAPRD